ncbi:KGW motif small protein [Acinetobacter sichuanensis]|nr:KGW motif small protein [Acinetobacter sichuanensis]MDQ9020078.1 KGW motif small protein [Acinetobacter sichuanensis]
MIKTVNYQSIDRVALRQKGWMWFGMIIALQIVFLALNYLIKI